MTPPMNTCTVTFSDAHTHTLVYSNVPAGGGTTGPGNNMPLKMDALRNVLLEAADNAASILSAFTPGDTLTVTVTQP